MKVRVQSTVTGTQAEYNSLVQSICWRKRYGKYGSCKSTVVSSVSARCVVDIPRRFAVVAYDGLDVATREYRIATKIRRGCLSGCRICEFISTHSGMSRYPDQHDSIVQVLRPFIQREYLFQMGTNWLEMDFLDKLKGGHAVG